MIRFSAAGVEFRLHVLIIIMAGLALALGVSREMPDIMLALFVHEAAHMMAARICGVEIEYIEIMPFGGAAHVRNLYSAGAAAITVTALAGPLANGLMMLTGGALGWWEILSFPQAARMIRINGMLMLFNLLPALPLDGGRVLYAAARRIAGRRSAVNIASVLAYILAGGLAFWAIWAAVMGGKLNLSFIIMAVFLTASTLSERRSALDEGAVRAVMGMCRPPKLPGRARLVALDAAAPVSAAARFLGGREVSLFAMLKGGNLVEILGENEMAGRIIAGADSKGEGDL